MVLNVIVPKEDGKIKLNKNDFAYIRPAETTDELNHRFFQHRWKKYH